MRDVALDISSLEIGYPQKKSEPIHVAGPIDISINTGELICLLGPNGVGKTTLLRTIAGIQLALNGKVSILNQDISSINKKKLARLLSVVLTDRISHGNLTAYELVSLGRTPYTGWFGNLNDEDRSKLQWAIDSTHIEHLANKNIHELSDGERQKVMIARALAQDTPVILLDEPTAHLDLPNRIDIVRLLRKLARETNKAIIMSTHELDLALQAADNIWLMSMENKTFSGAPEDLVLKDIFGEAFIREGIEFDKSHGVFKVVEPRYEEIYIEGNEIGVFWTKRAMERIGYTVIVGGHCERKIRVDLSKDIWTWNYTNMKNKTMLLSVEELVLHLKSEGAHP